MGEFSEELLPQHWISCSWDATWQLDHIPSITTITMPWAPTEGNRLPREVGGVRHPLGCPRTT